MCIRDRVRGEGGAVIALGGNVDILSHDAAALGGVQPPGEISGGLDGTIE